MFFTVIVIILDILWMGFIVVALFHYINTRMKSPYKTRYQILEERIDLQNIYNMVQEPTLKFKKYLKKFLIIKMEAIEMEACMEKQKKLRQ